MPNSVLVKGQLISKVHFVFFNSPKKRTKNFCPSRLGQKFEFSSSFFGRIGDTKKTFRNLADKSQDKISSLTNYNFFCHHGRTRIHQNISLWGMVSSQRALHKSDLRPNHPHQSCIGTLKEFDCHGTQPQNVPTNVQILPTDVCKISNHIKPSSQNRIIAPMQVHTGGTVNGV